MKTKCETKIVLFHSLVLGSVHITNVTSLSLLERQRDP